MDDLKRKNWIGASEVAILLGFNQYSTPLKLWAVKTGRIVPEEAGEAAEWGTRLERVVSEKFSELHNVKLMAYKKRYVHKEMPYFSCELDNIIVGTDEIVEIKTVNAYAWQRWDKPDELPGHVIVQVTAQMGLSGRSKAWVACLCGGQKYIEKEVKFDAELYASIEKAVKNFWENHVLADVAPMAIGGDSEVLVELNPTASRDLQEADETINDTIAHYMETKGHIDRMKKDQEDIKAKIMQIVGDSKGLKTSMYKVMRIDVKASEYVVKKEASWHLRFNNLKEKSNV